MNFLKVGNCLNHSIASLIFSNTRSFATRAPCLSRYCVPMQNAAQSVNSVKPFIRSCHSQTGVPADKSLSNFLNKEINLERNLSKSPKQGPDVPGFEIKTDGANITLKRMYGNEEINIEVNINGSVHSEEPELDEPKAELAGEEAPEFSEMKSKPDFIVKVKKPSGRSICFNCTIYTDPSGEEEEGQTELKEDLFQIESFYVSNSAKETDWEPEIYMGDGSLVDGEMYDLLMLMLEERGINREFGQSLIEYCSYYEHGQYISLLEDLKSFVDGQ